MILWCYEYNIMIDIMTTTLWYYDYNIMIVIMATTLWYYDYNIMIVIMATILWLQHYEWYYGYNITILWLQHRDVMITTLWHVHKIFIQRWNATVDMNDLTRPTKTRRENKSWILRTFLWQKQTLFSR